MLRIVFALTIVVSLAAGPQQQSTGTGVLAGRVIDAATAQPVAGASVHFSQARGGFRYQTTNADANGAFSFTGLSAGSFQVTASARGYFGGAVGKRRPLGDDVPVTLAVGERRDDLTIVMFKGASVSGRVVDENDQPVAEFMVEAWPRPHEPGLGRRVPPIARARTDATGTFHMTGLGPGDLSGLVPGDYVVVAPVTHGALGKAAPGPSPCGPVPDKSIAPAAPTAAAVAPPEPPVDTLYFPRGLHQPKPRADGAPMTYRTTFFPDAATIDDATTITLSSGESRAGVDLRMQLAVATTVKGELTSPKGFAHGGYVSLRLAGDLRMNEGDARASLPPGSATFALLDVPVGSYILEPERWSAPAGCDVTYVDSESKLTHLRLDVTPAGVDRLVVPLATGTTVSGSIVAHGLSKPLANIGLRLHSLDRPGELVRGYGDESTNSLRLDGVMPGLYELQVENGVLTPWWWLQTVTVGGRDVTGQPMSVGADGLNDVVVTLTGHPSSINGTVNTPTNQSVADATVVLFPVDRAIWQYSRVGALRFQTSRALRGVYEFPHVPAGEYFIAAIDETTMDAWPSSAFLASIAASATRVTVKNESTQTIWLTLKR